MARNNLSRRKVRTSRSRKKLPSGRARAALATARRELIGNIRLNMIRRGVLRRQQRALSDGGAAGPRLSKNAASWLAVEWMAPAITLYIADLQPETLLEGRIGRVHFGVCNTTSSTLTNLSARAVIRPQFFPNHISNVSQYDGLLVWNLPDLQPWGIHEGAITFEIPPASDRTQDQPPPNEIEVILSQYVEPTPDQVAQAAAMGYEAFGAWQDLASDVARFDSGSRYRLALTGISIKSIASFETDTVVVGVGGDIDGVAVDGQSEGLGDHAASPRLSQIPVTLNGVGYFPAVSNGGNDEFTLTYAVANSGGDSIDDLREALDIISTLAAAVAVAFTAGAAAAIWPAADAATTYFNDSLIRDCNRVIGTGADTLGAKDLFDITWQEQQTGDRAPLSPIEWTKPPTGDNSKACGTADYFVVRTVFRDRLGMEFVLLQPPTNGQAPVTLVTSVPLGGTLDLDALVTITPGNLVLGIGADKRMWELESGEGAINKNIYIAPTAEVPGDIAGFAVVKLTLLRQAEETGNGYIIVRYS